MQLLSVWIDSLKILKPKNFKLFTGAVFLAMVRTYHVWLEKWWWLILLLFGSVMYYGDQGEKLIGIALLQRCMYIVLMSFAYLSARPSLDLKTYRYFYEHRKHIFWMAPLFIAIDSIFSWMIIDDQRYFAGVIWFIVGFLAIINIRLAVLFIADSSGSIDQVFPGLVRALRMTFFTLPFLFIVPLGLTICLGALLYGVIVFIIPLVNYGELLKLYPYVGLIFSVMLMPLSAAFFATLYTKRLYDNSALYLP